MCGLWYLPLLRSQQWGQLQPGDYAVRDRRLRPDGIAAVQIGKAMGAG